ncbi:SHOCT domain-containing protein [Dactylosporangium sp. CA-092794]|uniref:SHOCT domain-containing protein n=1 Tax=Dactylosporangium sp. CA-092794 TaxID=3239929 RepID=UPI003D8F0781
MAGQWLGTVVLGTVWFMVVFAWVWLMVSILNDLFRDPSMPGWGKAVWTLGLIVFPWIGALVYLIARGRSMNERAAQRARRQEAEVRQYIREAAGTGATASPADELAKLAALHDRKVLNDAEYERARSAVLGANGGLARPRA